jgi:single-strand DNA-binding protein
MSNNFVSLTGNLGTDVELRYTQSGRAVANFRMATHERWTQDGQERSSTEWHRVVVWGKVAEQCAEEFKKRLFVRVTGKLRTRAWEDKNGVTHYTTEIHAFKTQVLKRREEEAPTPQVDAEVPF